MSGADLAWLRMERPTNPMTVVAVLILGSRLQRATVRALLQERLLCFERFSQLPVHDALGTHWHTAADFDLDAHLQCLRLPPRAGQEQLEAAAGRLAGKQIRGVRCGKSISSSAIDMGVQSSLASITATPTASR